MWISEELSSTCVALSLVEIMGFCLEKGRLVIASFLDLSKSFDCVSHEMLLQKLYIHVQFSTNYSSKLRPSFLGNLYQVAKTDSGISGRRSITKGIPQGFS